MELDSLALRLLLAGRARLPEDSGLSAASSLPPEGSAASPSELRSHTRLLGHMGVEAELVPHVEDVDLALRSSTAMRAAGGLGLSEAHFPLGPQLP